jgi:nitrate reductase NapAB chaperone NapD
MVVASGFVEVNGLENVENVITDLKKRGLEINDIEKVKVTFLIERDSIGSVKAELEAIRSIENVINVHLAYYSLEGADMGPEIS